MHEYYIYQKIFDWENYPKPSNDEICPEEVGNRVTAIPIFNNCEFDIDKLCANYNEFIDQIRNQEKNIIADPSLLKSDLYNYLSNSHASYLAPAYNYNCYLQVLIEDNIHRMNHEYNSALDLSRYYYTIIVQNILVSIKALLDRTVPIFSFYYGGFSLETTFGHIDANTSKGSGFMQMVRTHIQKHDDGLMKFIYEEYESWIKYVVEPRNTIMHYNDLQSEYRYPFDGRQFPMHHNVKVFGKTVDERTIEWDDGFYYKSLMKNVQDVYYFMDTIFGTLLKKRITYRKEHFVESDAYESYLKQN